MSLEARGLLAESVAEIEGFSLFSGLHYSTRCECTAHK